MIPAYDGPPNADVLIVGESWGSHEANWKPSPKPFVGPSGRLLDELLVAAGWSRSRTFITNVVHAQPPGNKIEQWLSTEKAKATKYGLTPYDAPAPGWEPAYCNDLVREGIILLRHDIERLRPKVIIGLGNVPLWALTGKWGITKWRGSELWYGNIPFIPTLHPAYLLRGAWVDKPTVIHDLRARVFGKMGTDRTAPPYRFSIDQKTVPALAEALDPLFDRLNEGPLYVSTDVETRRVPHARMVCIGFGWTELDAVCVPLERADGMSYWRDDEAEVRSIIRRIITHPNYRPLGQNFNYDAQYIELESGVRLYAAFDTSIAQHLIFPGTQKDLARLASLYNRHYVYWKDDLKEWVKDMDEQRMWRYNCLDVVATLEVAHSQMLILDKMGWWHA